MARSGCWRGPAWASLLAAGCHAVDVATAPLAGAESQVKGNPDCWRSEFTYDTCCDKRQGPRGREDCFDFMYTYEVCCLNVPGTGSSSKALMGSCVKDVEQLPRPLQCRGTQWVDSSFWEEYFHCHQMSQVMGTSFKGWPNAYEWFRKANASRRSLEAVKEDCIAGLMTLLLHALPSVEWDHGIHAAWRQYDYAMQLSYEHERIQGTLNDCRWNEMVNHGMFGHYPQIFGGDSRFTGWCPEGAPKIYVYDMGDLTDKPLGCARIGFWASEVYIDRYLRQSGCRALSPEQADFFFIPMHLTCWELKVLQKKKKEDRAEVLEQVAERVRALPYWRRRGGHDHIFLFAASAWILPGWRQILGNSVILAVEGSPIECTDENDRCWHCHDCFQPWKDLMVPPLTPLTQERGLLGYAREFADRPLIMTWHGQHANATDPAVAKAYRITNETVRLRLLVMAGLKNVSLGGPTSQYSMLLGASQFCLCPKGASSYTSRVFEALFAGCVPIILSDDVRLPFDRVVDWSKFSIRWPMEQATPELYEYLRDLLETRPDYVQALQAEVRRVRCWFDYFALTGDPKECSPYVALLGDLKERLRSMPRNRPPFAVPPP